MTQADDDDEARRLEQLWSGPFGDAYAERNAAAGAGRGRFWAELFREIAPASVLEVGCNVGGNIQWIVGHVPPGGVSGVDVNEGALATLRRRFPDVNARLSRGRELPFPDASFDLCFTAGVLIHQPEASLPYVMHEIVRCARRWVLALEYYAPETVEVPYRGETGALFKRDYGALYARDPRVRLLREGRLGRDEGWDDVTFWLFERVR